MIQEYLRPQSLEEALQLLAQPGAVALGGGTVLSRHADPGTRMVDLQALGLNTIQLEGSAISLGAMLTLQDLVEADALPEALRTAARRSTSRNLRQAATLGGTLVSAPGSNPLLAVLLAMDPVLTLQPGDRSQSLGDWLALRGRGERSLITYLLLSGSAQVRWEAPARSPSDHPFLTVAVARWPSGRVRAVLGGSAQAPSVLMDGPEVGDLQVAVENARSHLESPWFSQDYMTAAAVELLRRLTA